MPIFSFLYRFYYCYFLCTNRTFWGFFPRFLHIIIFRIIHSWLHCFYYYCLGILFFLMTLYVLWFSPHKIHANYKSNTRTCKHTWIPAHSWRRNHTHSHVGIFEHACAHARARVHTDNWTFETSTPRQTHESALAPQAAFIVFFASCIEEGGGNQGLVGEFVCQTPEVCSVTLFILVKP